MDGIIPLLSYVGVVITGIAVLRGIGGLIANSVSGKHQLPNNPLTFRTLWHLVRHLYREEFVILLFFLLTSWGLLAKYFVAWAGPPGNFLEFINLLCVVKFWVHFRTTDLGSQGK